MWSCGGVGEDSVEDEAVDLLQGWVQDQGLELHGESLVGLSQAF